MLKMGSLFSQSGSGMVGEHMPSYLRLVGFTNQAVLVLSGTNAQSWAPPDPQLCVTIGSSGCSPIVTACKPSGMGLKGTWLPAGRAMSLETLNLSVFLDLRPLTHPLISLVMVQEITLD